MSATIMQMVLAKRAREADALAREEMAALAEANAKPAIVWRGQWRADASYDIGDAVECKGTSYIATEPSQNQRPPGKCWDVLAAKGKDGKAGLDGASGGYAFSGGGSFDLSTLPMGDTLTPPQMVAIQQSGIWVQISWVDFIAMVSAPDQFGTEFITVTP